MTIKLKLLTIGIIIILATGCGERFVRVYDRYPEYTLPPKARIAKVTKEELAPLNEKTKKKIVGSIMELKKEAAALRAKLESYNKYAKKKNDEYNAIMKKFHSSK